MRGPQRGLVHAFRQRGVGVDGAGDVLGRQDRHHLRRRANDVRDVAARDDDLLAGIGIEARSRDIDGLFRLGFGLSLRLSLRRSCGLCSSCRRRVANRWGSATENGVLSVRISSPRVRRLARI